MDCPNSDGGSGDRSLPSMGGLPRWMKRATERYDYSDICASPPSNEDGFFHINRNRLRQIPVAVGTSGAIDAGQSNTNVECYQKRSFRTETADITASVVELERTQHHHHNPHNHHHYHHYKPQGLGFTKIIPSTTETGIPADCSTIPETNHFFKTVAATTAISTPVATTITTTSTQFQESTPTTSVVSSKAGVMERGNTYDSALSSADVPTMIITKPEHSTLKQMIEKMNGISLPPTPDATPNPTPTVTPACSPQLARRNPFFSGNPTPATNNSGSWLFRSSSAVGTNNKGERAEEHNYLYEAKPDFSSSKGPGGTGAPTQTAPQTKPNVRYVPRPSELRELNFWSPTSM